MIKASAKPAPRAWIVLAEPGRKMKIRRLQPASNMWSVIVWPTRRLLMPTKSWLLRPGYLT